MIGLMRRLNEFSAPTIDELEKYMAGRPLHTTFHKWVGRFGRLPY